MNRKASLILCITAILAISNMLIVNASPTKINLYFNETEDNMTVSYGKKVNITAKIDVIGLYVELYKNDSLISNETNKVQNIIQLNPGYYIINSSYPGNITYVPSNVSRFINVTTIPTTITTTTTIPTTIPPVTTTGSIQCNPDGTSTDGLCHVECKASNNCTGYPPNAANTCCSGCYYTDINTDGKTDTKDSFIVNRAFGSSPGQPNWNPAADINSDNKVDLKDKYAIDKKFGKTCTRPVELSLGNTNIIIIVVAVIAVAIIFGAFKFFSKKNRQ